MYVVVHPGSRFDPIDSTIFEDYDREAIELIVDDFLENGFVSDSIWVIDNTSYEEVQIEVKDYLLNVDIMVLKELEKNTDVDVWGTLNKDLIISLLKGKE